METRKTISERILFGPPENPKTIEYEITTGTRPVRWNVAGHPDHGTWVSIIEMRHKKSDPNTLCGPKEECFENGECWGHLEGVMCKFLEGGGEHDIHFFCNKKQMYIEHSNIYATRKKYIKCEQRQI